MTDTTVADADTELVDAPPLPRVARVGIGVAVAVGVVARFVADTPLWLDEALSVNIADVPLGQLDDALRQDGHPPLYYALLKGWMQVVGDGDAAVRALSGLLSVATLPLAWIAGRRLGGDRLAWLSLGLFAVSPFAIRYATEARMYSLLTLLALALWLLIDDARHDPAPARLAGIAVVAAGLCWTHYWSFYLLAAFGLWALVAAWRGLPDFSRSSGARVAGALVVGGLLFVPWVPALLDQLAHTGTPWGDPSRPAEVAVLTVFELGGGPRSEAQLLALVVLLLALLGLFGRAGDEKRVELDVRVSGRPLELAALTATTMGLGLLVGVVTASTFQPRYAAVVVPFILLLAARGLGCLRGPVLGAVTGVTLVAGLAVGVGVSGLDRSQGETVASVINAEGSGGDLVIFCPDQLGPSTDRYLDETLAAATFPEGDAPQRVDWRDYADRVAEADPVAFANEISVGHAGTIWVVMATSYRSLEGVCEQIPAALGAERTGVLVVRPDNDFYEPATLYRFDPLPSP
ncbi:MAG: glycosyltransferase family 39 protein [Acidimicrobiia bacterium]|nr:glycosyltransferase family 39 protein [Acidimicrobiia bacterium]